MEQEVIKKKIWNIMPKWLKIVLITLSIITVVFWLGFLLYWILEIFRKFLVLISDKKGFWIFIVLFIIFSITVLILMQFVWGLNPFGKLYDNLINLINNIRDMLAEKIKS